MRFGALSVSFVVAALLAGCDKEDPTPSSPSEKPSKAASSTSARASGSPTTPAVDDGDHSAELKKHIEGLMQAIASKDTEKLEPLLLGMVMTPDDANTWFAATFGPELGPKVGKQWEEDVFANLPKLIRPFKAAIGEGKTEVKVVRITGASDANATGAQKAALGKMVKPVSLYTVKLVKPGEDSGTSLWSFAVANGSVFFLGELPAAK
jgi:hypothetical protein